MGLFLSPKIIYVFISRILWLIRQTLETKLIFAWWKRRIVIVVIINVSHRYLDYFVGPVSEIKRLAYLPFNREIEYFIYNIIKTDGINISIPRSRFDNLISGITCGMYARFRSRIIILISQLNRQILDETVINNFLRSLIVL